MISFSGISPARAGHGSTELAEVPRHDERRLPEQELCRLCGTQANLLCKQRALKKYDVGYFQCPDCDLIQTERPFWLEEAYSSALSDCDTGAIQRTMLTIELTLSLAWLLGIETDSPCLDYGGGHGILARSMRDHGYDFRWFDRYAKNLFARGFETEASARYSLLTCFEVWEHLPDPACDLENQFSPGHDFLLIGTFLHTGHRENWWYYCPQVGQHVAFFSARTMQFIARRFGYHAIVGRRYTLFHKNAIPPWRRSLIELILRRAKPNRNSTVARLSALVRPRLKSRIWDDHLLLRRKEPSDKFNSPASASRFSRSTGGVYGLSNRRAS